MIPLSISSIQKALNIPESGVLDEFTEAAIRNYQLSNSIPATGIVDYQTANLMFPEQVLNEEPIMIEPINEPTTDLSEAKVNIIKKQLPRYTTIGNRRFGNYWDGPTKKEYIFIHHTAGWENPSRTIEDWARDTRGEVATQFVIGGRNPQTQGEKYDGEIIECLNNEQYGWHLGIGNTYMHTHSVGIELCNFGWVKRVNGKFLTWANTWIHPDEVVDLKQEYRGYQFYQRYSDRQLDSLKITLQKIVSDHNIDLRSGIQKRLKKMNKFAAFGYDPILKSGNVKGLFSHSNVSAPNKYGNYEKWDCFPQDELCDLILSL